MIGAGINKFLVDIAELVENKTLSDVVDISNQSGRRGIRIVLELKRMRISRKSRNILYKKTKAEGHLWREHRGHRPWPSGDL